MPEVRPSDHERLLCTHHEPRSPGKQRSGGRQATFRRNTFRRYGLACVACGHPGSPDNPIEAAHDLALDLTPEQTASFEEAESGVLLCRRCHRAIDAAARRARKLGGS